MDSLIKFIKSPFPHFVDVVFTNPTTHKVTKVLKKAPLNDDLLAIVEKLQTQYPHPLELSIYKANGTSFKRIAEPEFHSDSTDFAQPDFSHPTMNHYYPNDPEEDSFLGTISGAHFAQNQQARNQPRQPRPAANPGASTLANYIITEKNDRLREKDELIKDQKDEIKILKADLQKVKDAAWEKEKELKFLQKEHELDNYKSEIESSKGLNGLVDRVTENPQLLMGMMNMVAMFSGKPMPQLGMALPNQATAAEPQQNYFTDSNHLSANHQQIIAEITKYLESAPEEIAAKFFAVFLKLAKNPQNLDLTIQLLNN